MHFSLHNPRTGAFILDERGRIEVRLKQRPPPEVDPALPIEDTSSSSSGPGASAPPAGSIDGNNAAASEEVARALELSEAAPASMNFFRVESISEDTDGKQDHADTGT